MVFALRVWLPEECDASALAISALAHALINGQQVGAGDALLYRDEAAVRIQQGEGAELLVFDLPR